MGTIGRRPGSRRSLRLLTAGAVLSSAAAAGMLPATHAGAELPPAFVGTAAASGGRGGLPVPPPVAPGGRVRGGGAVPPTRPHTPRGDSARPPPPRSAATPRPPTSRVPASR